MARAVKEKKETKAKSNRGKGRLLKADLEAFKAGKRSPRARRNARLVDTAFRLVGRVRATQNTMDERMQKMYADYRDDGNGITITHPDGKRRVVFKKDRTVVGNESAERAAVLLKQYYDEINEERSVADEDQRQFLLLIDNVIQRNKSGIRLTSNVSLFLSWTFKSPILREAQKLLAEGFDAKESKLKTYCQVWDDERKEWVSQ